MATDDSELLRRQAIATAIAAELNRQGHAEQIDIEALAVAIDEALDPVPRVSEGTRPQDLNSANDG